MIRFMPDSWLDVVMRPLDMISPEANLYVEVAAPDVRLAAVLLLGIAVAVTWRRRRADARPAFLLLLVLLLAMVPWFATTGNGRYFIAFLVLLGPLLAGLVRLLPVTRAMRFAILALVALVQIGLVHQTSPWRSWALSAWREAPYFHVEALRDRPHSYVTLTSISYSLIAPQFHPASRWLNLTAGLPTAKEKELVRRWFAEAGPLHLIVPAIPSQLGPGQQPSAAVVESLGRMLQPRGLTIDERPQCSFLPSRGMVGVAVRGGTLKETEVSKYGFWVCPVRHNPGAVAGAAPQGNPEVDAVFEAAEKLCPRFFTPGHETTRIEGGYVRHYPSDTRIYLMEDGEVRYKFWRSLNMTTIGSTADLLAGRVTLDCSKIRAPTWRSGGP